jgi:hypothetical protein
MSAVEGGKLVLPGDEVLRTASLPPGATVRVGTGLVEVGSGLIAMHSGTVRVLSANKSGGDTHVWVDSNARRYTPCVQVCAASPGAFASTLAPRGRVCVCSPARLCAPMPLLRFLLHRTW